MGRITNFETETAQARLSEVLELLRAGYRTLPDIAFKMQVSMTTTGQYLAHLVKARKVFAFQPKKNIGAIYVPTDSHELIARYKGSLPPQKVKKAPKVKITLSPEEEEISFFAKKRAELVAQIVPFREPLIAALFGPAKQKAQHEYV